MLKHLHPVTAMATELSSCWGAGLLPAYAQLSEGTMASERAPSKEGSWSYRIWKRMAGGSRTEQAHWKHLPRKPQ